LSSESTQSFDLYGGLLPVGFVSDNAHPIGKDQWPDSPQFWTGNPLKTLPASAKILHAVVLSISSFKPKIVVTGSLLSGLKVTDYSGLHVGVWLSWGDVPVPKEHDSVFAFGNTGDAGNCNIALCDLEIPIPSAKFIVNFWGHNMRPDPSDWHTNGLLDFE
jgi:hypothetical protein